MQQASGPYTATFKAAVALEALRTPHAMAELSDRYSLPSSLIHEWMQVLKQNAALAFAQQVQSPAPHADLLDSSELARTIAENSTQGFAMMDQRGFCIYANKAWLDMTGYSAEEISSRPLHYLVHHHHPDGTPYPMEDCPIDRALPENFDVRAHEDVFFRKDGSRFDVACAASPIFSAGKPVATVIEIRDVTEQKKQARERFDNEQRALDMARAAEERRLQLDAILEAAPVGIGMADRNGKLIIINRANKALWGDSFRMAGNIEGYREFKAWWADGQEHHGQRVLPDEWAMARALQGDEVDNDIVEIEPFDMPEQRKTIAVSARAIRDDHSDITGAVVVQVDITAQRQAESALRQANRNKDEFIAVLAHELRNPLAPLRAAVDLFQLRAPDDPMFKRATNAMARQIDHITRLVDDLLDVARISRGKVELKLETCNVAQLVVRAVDDYRPTVQSNGVALDVDVPSRSIWVTGDTARLAQIVGNFLHNAAKFTRAGDRILVRVAEDVTADGPFAVISVQDSGVGMTQELVASLFNPFVQAPQGLGRGKGGLGLGLALVKGLSELHDGAVDAYSAGPGLGATFTLRLPLAAVAGETQDAVKPGDDIAVLKIVAIDDNEDALQMLSLLLGAQGHEVTLASDGPGGVDAISRVKPDIVICDIGLPGDMSGYDVARTIRTDNNLAGTMMIALSGYGQESDKRRSALEGFDAHLVKPVQIKDLESELMKASSRKSSC